MDYLNQLQIRLNYMQQTKPLCLKALQRKLRPFCKTNLLNGSILSLRLKSAKIGISITKSKDNYFIIKKNNIDFNIEIYAETNHELIYKLLKHKLLC